MLSDTLKFKLFKAGWILFVLSMFFITYQLEKIQSLWKCFQKYRSSLTLLL